jgi:hypothetical protein
MRWVALGVALVALASCGSTVSASHPARTTPTPKPFLVSYTATSGHFSAQFPSTPTETTVPASFAGYKLEIHVVVSRNSSGPIEVGEEDIQPALPADQFQSALVSALRSFSIGSSIPIKSQPSSTTYRNRPAWQATYSGNGLNMSGLVFMSGGTRLYLLFAPTDGLSSLTSSFKIVG